jgi:malic enzyme
MSDPKPLYISYAGPSLLETPLLNKGSAFTEKERRTFNLIGLLPPRYESIDEQVERAYQQFSSFDQPINKHIYLRGVQDNNETLFYRLLRAHLVEMLPIIYTPTVGEACEHFSDIYRSARGIFVAYEERDYMDDILRSVTKDRVKVIVVTDGERVLGLGDQGIGLGVVAAKSARVSDDMLMVASTTLAELPPESGSATDGILPALTDLASLSRTIAFAVAKMAMSEGHARQISDEELSAAIEHNFWTPEYREYRRIARS